MNIQLLHKLVEYEASNILKYATKKEINRLNFEKLIPDDYRYCIYGQMTGDCYSIRATKLIKECTLIYYEAKPTNIDVDSNELRNANITEETLSKDQKRSETYLFSPIEIFLSLEENEKENNLELIKYLRGENKTLKFN